MKMTTKQFMSTMKSNNLFGATSRLKKNGKIMCWIHPSIGWYMKLKHQMIPFIREKDGKEEASIKGFNCGGEVCPLCALQAWADARCANGEVDEKEILLQAGKRFHTWADVAGRGSDWMRKFGVKTEYVIAWIDRDFRDDTNPVELLQVPESLGYAIKAEIQAWTEEVGDEKGDPLITPYAFKFIYNEKESPMKKYAASRMDSSVAEITEEVEKIMMGDEGDFNINMKKIVEPGHFDDMLHAIERVWNSNDLEYGDFYSFYKDTAPEEESEDGDYYAEDVVEEKKKEEPKKPAKRTVKKKEETVDLVECQKCGRKVKPTKFKRCPKCGAGLVTENDLPF